MSDDLLPLPDDVDFPSMNKIVLPSRAILMSWRDQNLPARTFALEDSAAALDHYAETEGIEDHLLLGLIGDAMQPLEDLAYLGTAWMKPYEGLANYVRATAYWRHTATNFWRGIAKWDDKAVLLFAGLSGRYPTSREVTSIVQGFELPGLTAEHRHALGRARDATIARVRRVLSILGRDWETFSSYLLAHKHGGLAIDRRAVAFVDDSVDEWTPDTPTHDPSLAVWRRGTRSDEIAADFNLNRDDVRSIAAGSGRLAIDTTYAFLETRLAPLDAVEFAADGTPVGLRPMQLPWTTWLRKQDLDIEDWKLLGRGPTLRWANEEETG